jgi:hypothetical protein
MRIARGIVSGLLVLGGASWAAGCAGNAARPAAAPPPAAEPQAMAAPESGPKTVEIVVGVAAMTVDKAQAELSRRRNDKVHWRLEGGGTLGIEPKGDGVDWGKSLDVSCEGGECWGKIKRRPKVDTPLEYRVVVNGTRGPDPFIIIRD